MATPKRCLHRPYDTDLTFDRWTGTLYCWSTGDRWQARSGKTHCPQFPKLPRNSKYGQWGRRSTDPLPAGIYVADSLKFSWSRSNRYDRPAFRDGTGFYWFLHIVRCDLKGGARRVRSSFGIHPDGRPPGTAGCIGLTARDTRPIYQKLMNLIKLKGRIRVGVV
jgi:hypothetical protein